MTDTTYEHDAPAPLAALYGAAAHLEDTWRSWDDASTPAALRIVQSRIDDAECAEPEFENPNPLTDEFRKQITGA